MFLGQSNTKLGRGPQCCSDFHKAKTAQNHGIVITLRRRLTNALLKNLAVNEYQFYCTSIRFTGAQTRPEI